MGRTRGKTAGVANPKTGAMPVRATKAKSEVES